MNCLVSSRVGVESAPIQKALAGVGAKSEELSRPAPGELLKWRRGGREALGKGETTQFFGALGLEGYQPSCRHHLPPGLFWSVGFCPGSPFL